MDQAQNAQTQEQVAAADKQLADDLKKLKWKFIFSCVPIVFGIIYASASTVFFFVGVLRYRHGQAGAKFMLLMAIMLELWSLGKFLQFKLKDKP